MKKALSLLLAFVMVIGLMPMTTFAAALAEISFETDFSEEMSVGDTFTVTASMDSNPGIASVILSLDWNEEAVQFSGFEVYEDGFPVSDVLEARGWNAVANHELGIITAGRTGNNTTTGSLFTANFEIVGGGELEICLKNSDITEFEMKDASGVEVNTNIDYSAVEGLYVEDPNAVDVPFDVYVDDVKIRAITADEIMWPGMMDGESVLTRYTVTVPADAYEALLVFEEEKQWSYYDSQGGYIGAGDSSWTADTEHTVEIVDSNEDGELDGISVQIPEAYSTEYFIQFVYAPPFEVTVDDQKITHITTDVIEWPDIYGNPSNISLYIVTVPKDAEEATLTFVEEKQWSYYDSKGNYISAGPTSWTPDTEHVVQIIDSNEDGELDGISVQIPEAYSTEFVILFVREAGEAYAINIDEDIAGGTILAKNEEGEVITEATEGQLIILNVQADDGYRMKTCGYYYENQFTHVENGVFYMPAGEITLSATFVEIHTCNYDQEVAADKYLKEEATCQSGAVYYKSCECGEFAITAETFVSGDPVACHYVDGECEWCGAAEPVVAPGYRFATSADVSAENGGTAIVYVKITGHSDPAVTKYNAYDMTLTFDNEKLEYVGYDGAVKSDNGVVTVKENEIRIVGCGADKEFGTEIAALTFKTKKEGAANVTISKVQVSDKEEAVNEDIPEAAPKYNADDTNADETPDISVIVVPYTIEKPDFIVGAENVLHGEDYTFSYSDTTNYTYDKLIVKVGDVEVTPVLVDGVYTISNVTGKVEITATQTANSYGVEMPENVEGPDVAIYGEDYVFTVTPSDENKVIKSVTVTLNDDENTTVPYTHNAETGEYIIAGNNISGSFTIIVTETDARKMTTINFEGITTEEIEGGQVSVPAEVGKDFTFELIKNAEDFTYTVMVGEEEIEENKDGTYTIPGKLITVDTLTVTIIKEEIAKLAVDVNEYITLDGKAMFLITAKWGEKVLAYEEETMFYSAQYTVNGYENEVGAYCWLVLSTDEMNTIEQIKEVAMKTIVEAEAGVTATAIDYDCDVNDTGKADVNDAQLVYDMYNASYMEFTEALPMKKFLEADMTANKELDTMDVSSIINILVYNVMPI